MTQQLDLLSKIKLIALFLPWVIYYRAIIFFTPFSKIALMLHKGPPNNKNSKISLIELRWALGSIKRHLPIIPNCWSLAATGYKFALRDSLSAEIRTGIKKDHQRLKAHAWLICEDRVISGAKGHKNYTVTTLIRSGQVITQLPPQETLADGSVRFMNGEKP